MKFSNAEKTYVFVHPSHPEVKITIRRMRKAEAIDYAAEVDKISEVVPLRNPDDPSDYLRDKQGNIEVTLRRRWTAATLLSGLKNIIVRWEGLEGDDGPIPCSAEHYTILLEDELNVDKESLPEHLTRISLEGKVFESDPSISA